MTRERDDYRDALIRLQADFENYKKRMIKQQTDHLERAAGALVDKLLPVLDTADLALAHGGGEDVKQLTGAAHQRARAGGAGAHRPRSAVRSTPPCTTPSPTSRATAARRSSRCCGPGTAGREGSCDRRWSK